MKSVGSLHIYGPVDCHDDVFIVGTEDALVALRDGINAAIHSGSGACLSFTNDGEGFAVISLKESPSVIEQLMLPYSDEIARDHPSQGRKHPWTLISSDQYHRLISRE